MGWQPGKGFVVDIEKWGTGHEKADCAVGSILSPVFSDTTETQHNELN